MTFYDYFQKIHTFRVHTDRHAGNTAREMSAYITGTTGDASQGEELAEHVRQTEPDVVEKFRPYVTYLQSENGYYCRGALLPSPERGEEGQDLYHSVGIFFSEMPPEDILELTDERAREFVQKQKNGEFDGMSRIASLGPTNLKVLSTDFVTYDYREGVEVLWQSD